MKINISSLPAFYINMKDAHERKSRFISWNKKLGFKNVTKISGVYNDKYYIGLSKSFVKALSHGLKLKDEKFIVFEDDAFPTDKFNNEIDIPDDSDAVYLGVGPWSFNKNQKPGDKALFNTSIFEEVKDFPGVFKVYSTLTCHAILYVNKNYAKVALESYKRSIESGIYGDAQIYFDGLFDNYNVYAVGPFFYQHDVNKPEVLHETKNIDMKTFGKSKG